MMEFVMLNIYWCKDTVVYNIRFLKQTNSVNFLIEYTQYICIINWDTLGIVEFD